MSQTYLAVVVMLLAELLPNIGVSVGSDALTTTVSTIVAIGSAVWAMWARYRAGGITKLGFRK